MREDKNFTKFNWINLIAPTEEELNKIAQEYSLPTTMVEDCLEPEHLPKIEKFDLNLFIITRHFDINSTQESDTTQELTRKIAMFVTEKAVITVHRQKPDFWDKMMKDLVKVKSSQELVVNILYWVFDSYDVFLTDAIKQLEILEDQVFQHEAETSTLQKINQIKKRVSVVKHLLTNMQIIAQRFPITKDSKTIIQDLREELEAVIFRTISVLDETNSLLQLYLSLASHRTNEIMRVLTIFSVFFMPLTFIVGVYGMNFYNMPELHHPYGYMAVWGVMALVSLCVYGWFKHKGWLR